MISRFGNARGSISFSESLALKAVSLLLALIVWITILGFKREEVRRNVKLELLLPPGVVIINKVPSHIQFTLNGPRVLLKDVEKKIQPIRPDLRRGRDRLVSFAVSEDLIGELPPGVSVTGFSPTQVSIQMDELVERLVPVNPTLVGSLKEGYEVVSVKSEPAKVLVSGPRTLLNLLDSVGTDSIDVTDLEGLRTTDAEVLVDSSQSFQLLKDNFVKVKIFTRKIPNAKGS